MVDGAVGIGESVPFGHFWLRSPPAWWLYSFYFFGLAVALGGGVKQSRGRRRLLWVLGGWFLIGLVLQPISDWIARSGDGNASKLCFTFIDVGHGTNVIIETPDHETWLYDAGRMGDHQRSYQVMIEALWAMLIPKIDTVVLSHADADHYNGLEGIAKRIRIDRIVSTQQVFEHPSPLLQRNLAIAKRFGSKTEVRERGDLHQGKGWSTLALHPPLQGVLGSDNANSLCLLFEFAGRRVLLPGDLEPPGLSMLVAQDATNVDLLMAPHHGSLSSKADLLLKWCQPETVVISGSTRAMSPRVLQLFEAPQRQILVTARDDAIRYEIASDGTVLVRQWSTDRWVDCQ
jgi:competence protein ComEC